MIFEHVRLYNTSADIEALRLHRYLPGSGAPQRDRRNPGGLRRLPAGRPWMPANELSLAGIDCEVIDLRVLRPLDDATILESVRKTHRAVVVDEAWRTGSLAAEISARVMEQALLRPRRPSRPGVQRRGSRSRTPSTWRRRPCPRPPRSSPPYRTYSVTRDDRVQDARARAPIWTRAPWTSGWSNRATR